MHPALQAGAAHRNIHFLFKYPETQRKKPCMYFTITLLLLLLVLKRNKVSWLKEGLPVRIRVFLTALCI